MKTKASSVNQVKDNNTDLILNALKKVPSGTKSTVSQMTGLSIATCNTILNELSTTNKVLEVEGGSPAAGRPPKAYKFNADYTHVCCMYFTHEDHKRAVHYAIVNLLGEELEGQELEKDHIDANTIIEEIEELIARDPLINKISTGFSGYLSNGEIVSSGIPELWGCPLKQVLADHFNMEVHCDNDMNIVALGLFQQMTPESLDPFTLIGLFKGRCPGAGSIVQQRIVKGMSNFAGEVMHLNASSEEFWSNITPHYQEAVEKTFWIVLSYITTLNPKTIVLVGKNASGNMLDDIKKACSEHLAEEHIPKLLYIEDFKPYYIDGLFQKTVAHIDN